jgi:hypothetical protein
MRVSVVNLSVGQGLTPGLIALISCTGVHK